MGTMITTMYTRWCYFQISICSPILFRNQCIGCSLLVKSGSCTGVSPSLWNSALYRGIPHKFQSCSQDSLLMQFECVFCGQGVAQIPLCFICFGLFHSYYESAVTVAVLVLLSVFKGGLWLCLSPASVFRVARFAPSVSHHCFWLSPLTGNERFILSGLNYIVPSWLLVLLHSK